MRNIGSEMEKNLQISFLDVNLSPKLVNFLGRATITPFSFFLKS